MAVQYHTHTFELPTASREDVSEGASVDKLVVPASLGSAAAADISSLATSQQGELADTALQPADVTGIVDQATAATESLVVAAEAARDEAIQAASAVSYAATKSEMMDYLAVGSFVQLAVTLTDMTLSSADVPVFLENAHKIQAFVETTVNLPAGVFTTTAGDIMRVSSANARLRIVGATPIVTSLVSVASVTGTAGDWSVALNVASGAGIAVGDVLKLWNVRPLPHLSGDNAVLLAQRPAQNELYMPRPTLGTCTITASGTTAVFSQGTLSTNLAVGDLLTVKGQTRVISALNDGTRTATVSVAWSAGVTGTREYWVSLPNTGTCSTGGVASTTINFSNGITTAQANVGDLILVNGEMRKLVTLPTASSATIDNAITITAGTPYSIITAAVFHEGAHVVTAVSSNQITVANRSIAKPPVNRVSGGEVTAVKTVLRNTGTGDGLFFEQSGSLAYLDNVALRGSGASSGSHGLAMNGRLPAGVTQLGTSSTLTMGYNTAVVGFGRNAYLGYGCTLQARGTMFSHSLGQNVWVIEGGTANLRHTVISGGAGGGLLATAGAVVKWTEGRGIGNDGAGARSIMSTIYAELPFILGNTGHGFQMDGCLGFHMNEGVSSLNGLSGGYSVSGATSRAAGAILAGNGRYGLEAVDASNVIADEAWITGSVSHGVFSSNSRVRCPDAGIIGNGGYGVNASVLSQVVASNARFASNASGATTADASSTVLT